MKKIAMLIMGLTLLVFAVGCGGGGTPGISGEVELHKEILLVQGSASRIFVGAYTADQITNGDWPGTWADAKYSAEITSLVAPYKFEFVTGSSERMYVYAFLDQNGNEQEENPEPDIVIPSGGDAIPDVVGFYAKNPVVPIDAMLKDIDIVLETELE